MPAKQLSEAYEGLSLDFQVGFDKTKADGTFPYLLIANKAKRLFVKCRFIIRIVAKLPALTQ